ncbi:MAG: adenylate/guanylate cyclase domain-containing protein [Candidatus Eiseniibacteriota bacterium]
MEMGLKRRRPPPAPAAPTASEAGERVRVSIAAALVGGLTLVVLVAVGSVLLISLYGAQQNTFTLLRDNADTGMRLLEVRVRGLLDPVAAIGVNLARMIEDGEVDSQDRSQMTDVMRGALAATPQASGVLFATPDLHSFAFGRLAGKIVELPGPATNLPAYVEAMNEARRAKGPYWSAPIWLPNLHQAALTLRVPIRRDGKFVGVLSAIVTLNDLADYLEKLPDREQFGAFILYDNKYLLAHAGMKNIETGGAAGAEATLPTLDAIHDPAFALLLGAGRDAPMPPRADGTKAFSAARISDDFIVLTREMTGYGPKPWQLGLRFRTSEIGSEIRRLVMTAAIGLAILIVSVVSSAYVGRRLTRQIRRLATAADRLRTLELAEVEPVPDSRFRELSDAARAFNAMLVAMRLFETYLPKSLVLRLLRRADRAVKSEERDLTIMFTDIRAFSTLAERMRPYEIAELLNRHFNLLAGCIETEGGTVDKYIGDSIMAFWGAPDEMTDHAARALRAAAAIQRAVLKDIRQQHQVGGVEVAVRVGIHTGPVVVGNIGSESRLNYTVVGDAVNIASRIEQLAKESNPTDDCVVLVSEATAQAAGDSFDLAPLGEYSVKGRTNTVAIYRMAKKST